MFLFAGCRKDILKVDPSVSLTVAASPSPLTADMAKAWFESEFGKSKTVTPPTSQMPSAVNGDTTGIDGYYFDEVFQITPAWTQAEISTYLAVNPIVIVPVQSIAFLDAMNQQYALVVFRDSANQISAKLQVYDVVPQYKQAHINYDVSNFSGFFYQIALNGKVQNVLGFENGQFKSRVTLTPNENLGRFRATSRGLCASANNTQNDWIDIVISFICNTFKKGDGGGPGAITGESSTNTVGAIRLGLGFDYNTSTNNGNGGSGSNLGNQINNTLFTATQLRTKFKTLGFTPDESAMILENIPLKNKVISYFEKRDPSWQDNTIALAVKNNLFYADIEPNVVIKYLDLLITDDTYFNYSQSNNFSNEDMAFAEFYSKSNESGSPLDMYYLAKWWMKKTPAQRENFIKGFGDQAGEAYRGFVGILNFHRKWALQLIANGRYCTVGNCSNTLPAAPAFDSDALMTLFNTYKDIIKKSIAGDEYAQGQLMFEAAMFVLPIEELNAARGFQATTLFRGTSEGFAGNAALQALEISPTSINPAIATVFATESSNFGNGVIHIASIEHLQSQGVKLIEGNVLSHIEKEIPVSIKPADFASKAQLTITVAKARSILSNMGINIPANIRKADLSRIIENLPPMTEAQIETFIREAKR